MRGRTALLRHVTAGVDDSADWQTFPLGTRVITREGLPGVVVGFLAGPHAGAEEYEVTLDGGLGGGEYGPSELRPVRSTTAVFEPEAALEVDADARFASEDYPELEEVLVERPPPQHALPVTAAKKDEVPSVAGVVVKADDTGRVLLIQRSNNDHKDPASGLWEFPGGHMDDNEAPWDAGKREWEEETGHQFPEGHYGGHWVSPNGIYQGHVWIIPSEDAVRTNLDPEDRHVLNPDDPDGDDIEVMAWWDPEHLPKMPALRPEVKTSDWKLIKAAALRWYITPGDGTFAEGPFVTYADAQDLLDGDVYDPSEYRVVTAAFPDRIYPHLQSPEPGRPANPHATEKSRLSPEAQKAINDRIAKFSPDPSKPLTQDRLAHNIKSIYRDAVKRNPEAVEEGHHWYKDAHDFSHGLHHEFGSPSPRHSAGVVAALSPQLDWRENKVQAHYIHKHLADPEAKLRLSPEHAEEVHRKSKLMASNPKSPDYGHEPMKLQPGKRFADMGPEEAAHALKAQAQHTDHMTIPERITKAGKPAIAQFSNGEGSITKAIRIHRGEDPDDVLRGHKVRSFFNNINNPDSEHPDVTMDTHAVSLASGHKMAATAPAIKNLFSGGARKSENIMGTYAHFGDAYRQAHHELVQSGEMPKDSHPHALQAATWLHWRDMTVRGQKFYASDHDKFPEHSGTGYQHEKMKRQRQVAAFIASKDHDPGERIDPAGGPPEEEDPDLRQTEWNPFDPFKEGEDEDDENEGDEEEGDEDEDNDPKHPKPPRHLRLASLVEAAWHATATWKDVQAKAVKIRKEGGVRIISSSPAIVVGEVRGDTGTYQTEIQYVPGSHQIALWTCGCAWSSYSWGRQGRWKKYEGRVCSHTLALMYEAQSRGMFGREVKEDYGIPQWRKDIDLTFHEKPPSGPWMVPNIPTQPFVPGRAASKVVGDESWHNSDGLTHDLYNSVTEGQIWHHLQESHHITAPRKHYPTDLDELDQAHAEDHDYRGECGAHEAAVGELKDEPEPALPFTTSEEEDNLEPVTASVAGPETRSWLMNGAPSKDTSDIAAAARAFLAKEGAKTFTRAEQVALINEGEAEGVTASNLDLLSIEGTHYALLEAELAGLDDDENWLS